MSDPLGKVESDAHRMVATTAAPQAVPAMSRPYRSDPYAGPVGEADIQVGPNFLEYVRIVYRRRWLIVGLVAAFGVLGLLRTLMQTPLYTSTLRIQIDRNISRIVEGGNVTPLEGADPEFLRTHYEWILSRTLSERVASSLDIGSDASFFKPRDFSFTRFAAELVAGTPPAPPLVNREAMEKRASNIILGGRSLRPIPGSRLVDIAYTDPDPNRAARIATAYGEALIAANIDKRFQANAHAKTFLEDQTQQLRVRLQETENALLEFAAQEQIVIVTEKASIAESNLAAANGALGSLIGERIRTEQVWRQVDQAKLINLPQLLTNGTIDGLRQRRNLLQTEYQEKLETFKPGYPAMVQINNKIIEIDRQLAAEVKTLQSSYRSAFEAALNQEEAMKKRVDELKSEVLDLQKRSIQYNILKREVDTTRSLYNGLLQRFKEVDVASGVGANNIFVVDRAQVPGGPSEPLLLRAVMTALMLGLGLGLGAAFVLERLDDTVKTIEDLERITGLATLGVIPLVPNGKTFDELLGDPRSGLSESYRSLGTALQFSTESGLPKSLLITSAGPGEGKSSTVFAIGRHCATMGLKVLLVDADLRNPSLHKKLGIDNSRGLSNYLTGANTPPEVIQWTSTENLGVMPSGPLPPNAADLLAGSRLLSLLSVGSEVFDLIILDGPPVMGLADAPILSSAVASTIFVVGAAQARTGLVRLALRRLQMARSPIVGAVMTKFTTDGPRYGYGYGYGYAYSYGHADDAAAKPLKALPGETKPPRVVNG